MAAPDALLPGRAAAERLMSETFAAKRPTGRTVQDENTGREVPEFADEGTTVGKVAGRSGDDTTSRTVTVGGVERPVVEGGLHISVRAFIKPDETLPPMRGWVFECTRVGALSDVALLGRRFLVDHVPAKSHATARRLDVVELP